MFIELLECIETALSTLAQSHVWCCRTTAFRTQEAEAEDHGLKASLGLHLHLQSKLMSQRHEILERLCGLELLLLLQRSPVQFPNPHWAAHNHIYLQCYLMPSLLHFKDNFTHVGTHPHPYPYPHTHTHTHTHKYM